MNNLIYVRQKYLQKKSINSEKSKSPGNDGLTVEFYKHFANELFPVLLDVYDSWGNLLDVYDSWGNFGTLCVTSRTGIVSVKYKIGDRKDMAN